MHVAPDHLLAAESAGPRQIVDREKVLAILQKRFPGSSPTQVAAAANALVSLRCDWHEVADFACADGRRLKLFEQVGD